MVEAAPPPGPVVCFGEMLVRLATAAGDPGLAFADRLDLHVGGAEANVAVALAGFGHRSTMITALPDGPLGDRALVHLRGMGVDARQVRRGPGRMGLYFVETGAALRRSRVVYDRAASLFALTDWRALDWRRALGGAALLHLSGIALAVSEASRAGAIAAMTAARASGIPVSFDGNYRSALWAGREAESGPAVAEALALADIAFVDHRDAALALGRPVAADEGIPALFAAFPSLRLIAHTRREVETVEIHHLSAHVGRRGDDRIASVDRRIAGVVDRIGGGDAFAAGVLHGWLEGRNSAGMAASGLIAAGLKHSQRGDALLADRAMIDDPAGLDVRR